MIGNFYFAWFLMYNYFLDVYVDRGRQIYKALKFKKIGYFGLMKTMLSSKALVDVAQAISLGLGGNISGDGWQMGGCLVVESKGSAYPLLYYVQEFPTDHVSNSTILQVDILIFTNCNRVTIIHTKLVYNPHN